MSRRKFLSRTLSTAGIVGLAGCSMSSLNSKSDQEDRATLDRIVLRADTEQTEQLELTLVYAPRDGSTIRPVWGTYDAPASGDIHIVSDFEAAPGFYSLTARSTNHCNAETSSFNSYGNAVSGNALQFEVVVKRTGDVWASSDEAGKSISIPGY